MLNPVTWSLYCASMSYSVSHNFMQKEQNVIVQCEYLHIEPLSDKYETIYISKTMEDKRKLKSFTLAGK